MLKVKPSFLFCFVFLNESYVLYSQGISRSLYYPFLSEQSKNYHQVRKPFELTLSLIKLIMGPCPPFAPTQLGIRLSHHEYFFTFSSMDTVLCPYLCCCLQLHLIFNQYKTCTVSCEMLPLSACLVQGTEIRGRTSHLTLNLSSYSCLETLAICPAKCIQCTGLCIQS